MDKTSTETPITIYTLEQLIALSGGERRTGLMGECIAVNSESYLQDFRFPCRIDAFIIGVGVEGETTVALNLNECRLRKDSLFIFTPNNILQVLSEERFKTHVIAVSSEFMHRINIDFKHMMPLLMQFGTHPCIALTTEESSSLRSFISLIEQQTGSPETEYAADILRGLLSATIYKIGDTLHHYLKEHPDATNPSHDRTEAYFRQFMQLLGQHYRSERSVGFYARQLCITPKYLTTLIKRISGRSVSEWIDSYVILEAKTLLHNSHMSIQEIAYYLSFPNQSFFGSYFKRNTGMSPSQYKEQR